MFQDWFVPHRCSVVVSELTDNWSLRDVVQDHGTLPWEAVLCVAIDVIPQLHDLHNQGYVHCNVTPETIRWSAGHWTLDDSFWKCGWWDSRTQKLRGVQLPAPRMSVAEMSLEPFCGVVAHRSSHVMPILDLDALAMVLCWAHIGSLPWWSSPRYQIDIDSNDDTESFEEKSQSVLDMKIQLLESIPVTVANLSFQNEQQPNYGRTMISLQNSLVTMLRHPSLALKLNDPI